MSQGARIHRLEERAGRGRGRFYFIVFGRTLDERDALIETARERGEIRRGDLVERVPWTLAAAPPPPRWIVATSQFSADEDAMIGKLLERRLVAIHAEMERRGQVRDEDSPSDGLSGLHGHELHADIIRHMPAGAVDIDLWITTSTLRPPCPA